MSSPGDSSGCYGLSWTYDLWGNRTSQTTTSGTCYNFSETINGNNQLTGPPSQPYQYDAAGNLINDGTHSYHYNANNQLDSVDGGVTATYLYTVEGWRGSETTAAGTRDFVHDRSGNVLNDITSNTTTGWQNVYFGVGGQIVGLYTAGPSGSTSFLYQDHIGSTRLLTTLSGGVQDSMDYLPFGEQMSGGSITNQKFAAYDRDAGNKSRPQLVSLLRKHCRPMDVARPFGWQLANPQSWNAYSYVKNNPTTLIDPFGLDDDDSVFNVILQYNSSFYDPSLGAGYDWYFNSMSGFSPLVGILYIPNLGPIYLCASSCTAPQATAQGTSHRITALVATQPSAPYVPTVPFLAPAAGGGTLTYAGSTSNATQSGLVDWTYWSTFTKGMFSAGTWGRSERAAWRSGYYGCLARENLGGMATPVVTHSVEELLNQTIEKTSAPEKAVGA